MAVAWPRVYLVCRRQSDGLGLGMAMLWDVLCDTSLHVMDWATLDCAWNVLFNWAPNGV